MAPGYSTRIVRGMGLGVPSPTGTSTTETNLTHARQVSGFLNDWFTARSKPDTLTATMTKLFITSLACALAQFTLAADSQVPPQGDGTGTRPNILIILSDDQGYADAGFQGSTEIPTPHLDRLAREGVRCTSGYVTHPYCSPSRAGLLTGRYQMRFGHERNPFYDPGNHHEGLPATETLLPQYLVKAGYATGWIGKWHLGAAPEFYPENRGFQETFGFIGGGHNYQDWKTNPASEYNVPIRRNGRPVEVKEHLTLAFGHEAAAFINQHTEGPWFLYLAFNAPHGPHQPTAERLAKFAHIQDKNRRAYDAQVSLLDDAIGEALDALRSTGQGGRTLVFFLSDNGGPTSVGANNGSLRGCKGTTYEGGVRVPFVVSWPGRLSAGKEYHQPVSSLDIFATALACAGVPMPTDRPHDGANLLPFLSGDGPGNPHRQLFWRETELGQWGLREGPLKLVRRTQELRPGPGKLARIPLASPSKELFDLASDVGETNDIAAAQGEALKRLNRALDEWCELAAPLAFTGIRGKEPEPATRTESQAKPTATERAAGPASSSAPVKMPRPTAAQLAWQDAELGVMFHFDPRIYNNGGNSLQAACGTPLKDPDAYAARFNPTRLNTDQWIAAAKAMGARFAILVVKHETGFCLWQSDATPFSLKSVKWGGGKADILRDFIASCRKGGIKPGIFTEARWDLRLGVHDFKVSEKSPLTQPEYNRLVEREVEELCTRYGDLFEIWFDGGVRTPSQGGPDVLPIVQEHQPGILFYHSAQRADARWGGTESGTAGYPCWATTRRHTLWSGTPTVQERLRLMQHGDPEGGDWCPAMADAPLRCENGRHDWIWQAGGEKAIATLRHLQEMFYGSVGRNSTLIIGLTPGPDGLVPEADLARCREFGDWLQETLGGAPLAEVAGQGRELRLEIPAAVKTPVTHIILHEDIRDGERVRKYVVEAEVAGEWKPVAAGRCIGHKRIEKIEPCDARQYRLRVLQATAEPQIRAFSLR
jgi:arylsulfatase A-like enzyme/alpha-L-fucosidase